MSRARISITASSMLLLGGCVSNKPPPELQYAYASDVINALKGQLSQIEANPIDKDIEVPDGSCGTKIGNKTRVHVKVTFESADVVCRDRQCRRYGDGG